MDTPATLKTAAVLLTAYACAAAWYSVEPFWPFLAILWLATGALLRRNRLAWAAVCLLSFSMAAFGALITWKAASRPDTPAWFLTHFRWTALYWLSLAALVSAPASRKAVFVRAQ